MACFVWLRDFHGPRAEIWREHVSIYRNRSDAQSYAFASFTEAEASEQITAWRGGIALMTRRNSLAIEGVARS